MKKIALYLFGLVAATALLSSCCATSPVCATSNTLGSKQGVSTQQYVLGFACNKGGGIEEAAKAAGITKISHVDVQTQPLWPLIGQKKTIVYGE